MTPEYHQHVAGLQAKWFYRYSVKQLMGRLSRTIRPEPVVETSKPTAEIVQLFPRKE